MAIRGVKPKPTKIKILEGNPGKRALNKNEPVPPTSKTAREWETVKENPVAHRAFRENVKVLRGMGILTDAEVPLVNIMALCQARIEEAEAQVEQGGVLMDYTNARGEENKVQHPAVGVSIKYAQMLKSLATEFGLTPSSRGRLEVPVGKDVDPFEAHLRESIEGAGR